jgi:hypothetical protein
MCALGKIKKILYILALSARPTRRPQLFSISVNAMYIQCNLASYSASHLYICAVRSICALHAPLRMLNAGRLASSAVSSPDRCSGSHPRRQRRRGILAASVGARRSMPLTASPLQVPRLHLQATNDINGFNFSFMMHLFLNNLPNKGN